MRRKTQLIRFLSGAPLNLKYQMFGIVTLSMFITRLVQLPKVFLIKFSFKT